MYVLGAFYIRYFFNRGYERRKNRKPSCTTSQKLCENKNVSYEAHLCPIIVKAQRAPNAEATLQIVDRQYEVFLSPAALTLKPF
jgi:hypothetical protein